MVNPYDNPNLIALQEEFCKKKTQQLSEERFQCSLCEKLFRGPNFVEKHILNKHVSDLKKRVNDDFFKGQMFDRYLADPNKPINQPS